MPTTEPDSGADPRQEFYDSQTTIDRNAEVASLHAFESAMYTLSSGAVDRARASADAVQKSAAAVATLYTGILALVFSVTSNPLPLRGALTPVFLGAAVVLAATYLAFLGPVGDDMPADRPGTDADPRSPRGTDAGRRTPPATGLEPKTYERINRFGDVTAAVVTRRSTFLRASVVALGVGLAFIPAPLVTLGNTPAAASRVLNPGWPTPTPLPAGATANPEDTILYQARITEVTALHNKILNAPAGVDTTWDVWTLVGGLAVGTVVIGAVTVVTAPRPRRDRGGGGGVTGR